MNGSNARRASSQRARYRTAAKRPQKRTLFYHKPGKLNIGFVATLGVLVVFGLVMLFSASYATAFYKFGDSYKYIRPQVIYAIGGLFIMWVLSRMDYHWIRPFAGVFYITVLVLLVVVLGMEPIKGCRRWINVRYLPTLQVSELAKFSMILAVANLYDRYQKRLNQPKYGFWLPIFLLVPIVVLLYLEPHNSAIVLIGIITISMMFAGGCRMSHLLTRGGVLAAMAALAIFAREGYVQTRLDGWDDPFADMLGSTLQTGQSLYTIGAGGLFGVGIGNSVQKHSWLPEAPNDFIFSILCEELGFVGAVACIILFALLVIQGIVIAVNAPDRFGFLLVLGTVVQVGIQFMFNVAVVTNLVPNTGISLPFFSSGGTSVVLLLAQMGFVLSVCRAGNKKRSEQQEQEAQEMRKRIIERNSRSYEH